MMHRFPIALRSHFYWPPTKSFFRKTLHNTMGKGKKRSSASGSGKSDGTCWSGADHALHAEGRRKKLEKRIAEGHVSQKERRRQALTHETAEKKEDMRLKLHLTKTRRELTALKDKLENYDPVEEKEKEEERQRIAAEPPKKKGRKGPETWKLRGAARPASEVYDFDTRYVDPHLEAHKKATAKAQRSQNMLAIYKGKFGSRDCPEPCRTYLALLMQLGHLSQEAKQFKSARSAWLECIELEGHDTSEPITSARESLMRMYLDLKRHDAALRLGEKLPNDTSVWIRYSTALLALTGKEKDKQLAHQHLASAIRANPLCAYYLALKEVFKDAIDHTEDITESDDEPQSSLEEAIEYCTSEYATKWDGEPAKALRDILMEARKGKLESVSEDDVNWEKRLDALDEEFELRKEMRTTQITDDEEGISEGKEPDQDDQDSKGSDDDDKSGSDVDAHEEEAAPLDLGMYVGMFRTAMDMAKEDGLLG